MKKIEIKVQGATALPYTELEPFQGELKSLHKDDYEKLRKQIISLGFSEPIAVWQHDGHNYILNGHQRLRTVSTMVEKEGFSCPPLPIVKVEARNHKEAKHKVLALTSQYGKIEKEGLYEFMHEAQIQMPELKDFKFPEVNLGKFEHEFFTTPEEKIDAMKNDDTGEEDLKERPSKIVHTCPRCKFEFR